MLQNRSVWITGLLAGALMALLSTVPLINLVNCLLCGWLWLGGMFAVWYYKRSHPEVISQADGALLGAVAGLIGAVIASLLGMILGTAALSDTLAQAAGQAGQTGDAVIALLAGGLGTIIGLVFNLIFYIGFGALGGLIGASIFGKRGSEPSL